MQLNTLFYLALILFAGLLFGRVVKLAKLPNVTGYLIAGLLIGPFVLRLVPADTVKGLELVSEMALAFIAFSIGSEFKITYLKKVGPMPVVIAIFEGLTATSVVALILALSGFDAELALLLGAIASATAPAATIMVIKQYRAKGPVTETLLSVVALDDAVALIAFGFAVAIVNMMQNPGETSLILSILKPVGEILGSLLLGFLLGIMFKIPLRYFKKDSNRLIITSGFVFLGSSLASMLGLSPLLLCMAMSATLVNVSSEGISILKLADSVTPPIFLMFFVVSGMELDITVLPQVGLIGILYIIFRVVGKIVGAAIGAAIMKAPAVIRKYVGFSLVPQAGVAIGLSLLAAQLVPEYAQTIRAVVLSATLIYELTGPAITKVALNKAGELNA
ncbi:MAG TPA: cation:proton antiporter [Clostridiales bacterium]|mgnify:CR=1 FL=1|nr:cation:proton antiporter [Clostridiales bacterium]HOL92324.1 cation:proton antiporter [Clostridiales bacterium]HPP35917.1 cation:proton antiporter [Clostridiales bacterium]